MSIMILFCHSTGYTFYSLNGIALNQPTINFIDFFWNKFNAWVGVAGFFLFSGFLFFSNFDMKKLLQKWKNQVFSLIIPFLAWNIISVFYAILIECLPFINRNITGTREHFSWSVLNILRGIFLYQYNPAMWYMLQLIIFTLMAPIIYFLLKNKLLGIATVLCTYVIYCLEGSIYPLLINTKRQDVLFYYILGAYLGLHFSDFIIKHCRCKNYLSGIFLILLIILAACGNFEPLYRWTDIPLTVLFLLLLWYVLDLFLNHFRMGRGIHISFFIYASHTFIEPCINKLIWLLFPHNELFACLNLFGGAFFTLLIIYFLALFMKRIKMLTPMWNLLNGKGFQKNIVHSK